MMEHTGHKDTGLRANVNPLRSGRDTGAARSAGVPPVPDVTRTVSMPLVLVMVQLGDALSIAGIGVGAALWARSALSPLAIVSLAGVATFAALNLMHMVGAYRQNLQSQLGALIRSSLGSWIFTSAAVAMLVLAAGEMSALDREWLELWFIGTTGLILLSRYALWVSLRRWRRRGRMQRKVAVLGAGQIGQRLIQNLLSAPEA